MHISNNLNNTFLLVTLSENQKKIVINAKIEFIRRLALRYPSRQIQAGDISCRKIEEVTFNDGSLGCPKPGVMYTQGKTKAFVVEFGYNNQIFHLHTTTERYYVSNDLKVEKQYKFNEFEHLKYLLAIAVDEDIDVKDLIIDSFETEKSGILTYEQCNRDFDLYRNQDSENKYLFHITYRDTKYTYCFNDEGEARKFHNL